MKRHLLSLLLLPFLLAPLAAAEDEEDPFSSPSKSESSGKASDGKLFTRTWNVGKSFFSGIEEGEDGKPDYCAALKGMGVNFPKGSSAKYSTKKEKLTVCNTVDNLDAVEEAVKEYRRACESAKEASLPKLCQWSWKIPKSFIKSEDTCGEFLDVCVEWFLDNCVGVSLRELKGANAKFKGGKLTVIHDEDNLKSIDDYFKDFTCQYKISHIGKMKKLETKEIEKCLKMKKPKPKKSKYTCMAGEEYNFRDYVREKEKEEREYHGEE